MAIRTFKQKAKGFGSVPVNITAKINGVTVFTGNIITDANPPPPLPDPQVDLGEPVFSWTNPDILFSGSTYMEVTVNNNVEDDCFLYITDTIANYLKTYDANTQLWHYLGPDVFGYFFFETINNPADPLGPWISGDPQSAVVIDGVPVEPHPVRSYPGQYYWRVLPQQTLTCTINVQPGAPIPDAYDNTTAYTAGTDVTYNGLVFRARQATTGNVPTNATYWRQIGIID